MGLLKQLEGNLIFLDTAPLIYFVEEREPYAELLTPFFETVDAGKIHVYTSMITYAEALVHPYRQGNQDLIETYEMLLLKTPCLTIVPFNLKLARQTAEIRAKHGLKTPDAIQWATAMRYGVKFFLTNDRVFQRFSDPQVLLLDDL